MNKKIKIFIFWIGDIKKIESKINYLKKIGFDVIVGPTTDEHKKLSSEYSYYKKSFDQKIFSFCSDIWRLYKLKSEDGIYCDTSIDFGSNAYKQVESFSKMGNVFFWEDKFKISSAVLCSFSKDKSVFSESLELFGRFKGKWPRTFPIAPYVLSFAIKGKNEKVMPISFIRDKNSIFKTGSASWSKNFNANKYWLKMENRQKNDSKKYSYYGKKYFEINDFEQIFVPGLRDEYDQCVNKKDLKELQKMYKNSSIKPRFKDKLVWSHLYRFFTLKWKNTK